jgi:predicted nucleotidyltransferase component of viral defense system
MIPAADITAWRASHPCADDAQVEQDLVISRALVELFRQPLLQRQLLFRGGTALHKLYLAPASRYSEDIDLVQAEAGPIGNVISAIRTVLDPWLGEPKRLSGPSVLQLLYRYDSELPPTRRMRLKIEINTREHFSVFGAESQSFAVNSRWFAGECTLQTYRLEELLGTKMRALYQRRKGRDLFDLWEGLTRGRAHPAETVRCFAAYMQHGSLSVSRREYRLNLEQKLADYRFQSDLPPLLRPGIHYTPAEAHALIDHELLSLL